MNYEFKYDKLLNRIMKFVNLSIQMEKIPQYYGTDELYYKLEIHTIHIIGEKPGINVTEIAKYHGISKSAVSQVIKKIEKKGDIYRYKAPDNNKEILFKLTDKGKKAYNGHIKYHMKIDEPIVEKLETISDEKLKAFEEVLDIFEDRKLKLLEM